MTPEQLSQVHAACFPQRPWSASEFADFLKQRGVICCARGAQGFALARQTLDEAELLTIAVLPDARSRGIGHELLTELGDLLAKNGTQRLFLEVAGDNAPARALYAKSGFVHVGARKGYYPRPDGVAADALILERKLA